MLRNFLIALALFFSVGFGTAAHATVLHVNGKTAELKNAELQKLGMTEEDARHLKLGWSRDGLTLTKETPTIWAACKAAIESGADLQVAQRTETVQKPAFTPVLPFVQTHNATKSVDRLLSPANVVHLAPPIDEKVMAPIMSLSSMGDNATQPAPVQNVVPAPPPKHVVTQPPVTTDTVHNTAPWYERTWNWFTSSAWYIKWPLGIIAAIAALVPIAYAIGWTWYRVLFPNLRPNAYARWCEEEDQVASTDRTAEAGDDAYDGELPHDDPEETPAMLYGPQTPLTLSSVFGATPPDDTGKRAELLH